MIATRTLTIEEWRAEATRRFGPDEMQWAFECPSCGHVARMVDWRSVGAKQGEVAFSCVGRHIEGAAEMGNPPGPCNYAGGGLIGLNPVTVIAPDGIIHHIFEFAEVTV